MNGGGFVNQAYRDMLNWQWYYDITVRALFEHLLRIINKDDKMECGLCIKAGSVLTSHTKIALLFNLTEKQVKHAMAKLLSSHDISIINMHKKGIIITITEWNKYKTDNAYNTGSNNAQKLDENQNVSDNCPIQNTDSKSVVAFQNQNVSDKCPIKPQNALEKANDRPNVSDKCPIQHSGNHDDTKVKNQNVSDKCPINEPSKEQENETEKKEESPIPPEEIKEKDKEKESVIQEEKNNIQKEETEEYPFEAFWDAYGRKIDRPKCERKWARLSKEDKRACMEYIPKYVAATPDIQFRRHPATFLNNRSWENDLPSRQTLLPFGQPMSYGDRKRMMNGPELGHMPGTGEIIDTEAINKEGPF